MTIPIDATTRTIAGRDIKRCSSCSASEMERPTIEGRPNPLCSARWNSDPDYVARVICGHSGRLTVEQIRMIRALHVACRTDEDIAILAATRNVAQVRRLLSDRTYSRVH